MMKRLLLSGEIWKSDKKDVILCNEMFSISVKFAPAESFSFIPLVKHDVMFIINQWDNVKHSIG